MRENKFMNFVSVLFVISVIISAFITANKCENQQSETIQKNDSINAVKYLNRDERN